MIFLPSVPVLADDEAGGYDPSRKRARSTQDQADSQSNADARGVRRSIAAGPHQGASRDDLGPLRLRRQCLGTR